MERIEYIGGEEYYRSIDAAHYSVLKEVPNFKRVKRAIEQPVQSNKVSLGRIVDDMLSGKTLDIMKDYYVIDKFPTQRKMEVLIALSQKDTIDYDTAVEAAREKDFYNNLHRETLADKIAQDGGIDIAKAIKEGKSIITRDNIDRAERIVRQIREFDVIKRRYEGSKIISQLPLVMEFETQAISPITDTVNEYKFKLKGLPDFIIVDHSREEIIIADLKVTEDFYNYYYEGKLALQAAIYSFLVYNMKKVEDLDNFGIFSNYKIKSFDFIVYDTDIEKPYLYYIDIEDDRLLDIESVLFDKSGQEIGNRLLEYLYGSTVFSASGQEIKFMGLIERLVWFEEMKRLGFEDDPKRLKPIKL